MKKIDFHIHTSHANYEEIFDFSLNKLKEYVESQNIDGIAITNHNLFNLEQFKDIEKELDICILPGIEIDLENGHLLLISNNDKLDEFKRKCDKVTNLIKTENDSITLTQLKESFVDLEEYLLIPHYDKEKNIKIEILKELLPYIVAGEVGSKKKFKYALQKEGELKLTPVLFSDIRIKEGLEDFPVKQTYIDTDVVTFTNIKSCLLDKHKVSLSSLGGHELIEIFANGQQISTKLTVIIGARSSGKTVTLEKIKKISHGEKILYIKQFELVNYTKEEDEKDFNTKLSKKEISLTDEYLQEFKGVVNDVAQIDIKKKKNELEDYIQSLIKYAESKKDADVYAKTKIFNETKIGIKNTENLKKTINTVEFLLENTEYRKIITKHVERSSLINLYKELISELIKQEKLNKYKTYTDIIINNIKNDLHPKSQPDLVIEDCPDLYELVLDEVKLEKFKNICTSLRIENDIKTKEEYGKFTIIASKRLFNSASELYKFSRNEGSFTKAFTEYDNPIEYLNLLKESNLNEDNYYKYFVKIDYRVLNEHGGLVSGGERSEFRLLEKLGQAFKYDILLIDEPESSFDNIFLHDNVNRKFKELAKKIPIVLTTHNNTVGASIQPNYILNTRRSVETGKEPVYSIFSGKLEDTELVDIETGESILSRGALLDCLEAGDVNYKKRQKTYYK